MVLVCSPCFKEISKLDHYLDLGGKLSLDSYTELGGTDRTSPLPNGVLILERPRGLSFRRSTRRGRSEAHAHTYGPDLERYRVEVRDGWIVDLDGVPGPIRSVKPPKV